MTIRCLIVDELHQSFESLLGGIGVEFSYQPKINRPEIKASLKDYDGLIIRSKTFVDEDLLGDSTLLFVARAGAGVDNLDEKVLNERNIEVLNAPEGNRDAVGEHTIGMILSLLHNLQQGNDQVRTNIWDREGNRGNELASLTVGILGYGNSGSAVAKKLQSFGCRIIAYDKYLNDHKFRVDEETFYRETDILTVHIPLTQETDHLIDASYLNRFLKPIIFLNMARGEIASLAAINSAISSGKIIKAGLDVLECERFSSMTDGQRQDFERLKESGKVLFTPHVAGWTFQSYARINAVLAEKIGAFLEQNKK